ncbi:hypothetical protein [uncultured Chitinophaga sp.]|uniref:hypothetical protein n=1 Tax=uncultured Chitinophaga sp. TaxID=339340 RepID=UPI0025F067B7|nr:hypothetical protein [uncultured Chitinophaga sp.]
MSNSRTNAITYGMSGKFGNQFVLRDGVLCQMPKKKKGKKSEKQQKANDNFLLAARYAKAAIDDPLQKEVYQAKASAKKNAYNLAMSDAFHAPRILAVKTMDYSGEAGSRLLFSIVDDFRVQSVKVSIYNAAGDLLEEGVATQENGQADWQYLVKQGGHSPTGGKVLVKATDLPGNETEREFLL